MNELQRMHDTLDEIRDAGLHLMEGLHLASKVLPRIVSASYLYPRFMSPQGWPELQRMESLEHFAENSRGPNTGRRWFWSKTQYRIAWQRLRKKPPRWLRNWGLVGRWRFR